MIDRLEQMEQRYEELSTQLGLPEVITDHEKYQKAGRALRELEAPVMKFRELREVRTGLEEARAMLADPASLSWKKRSRCCCFPRIRMTKRT